VSEVGANDDGFSTSPSASQQVHVGAGQLVSITFTNTRGSITTFVPPVNPPPSATPTNTVEPDPEETVAGEITPGPTEPKPTEPAAGATPIAPDAGTGTAGAAGTSIFLVLLGLAAITLGSGFLALGRKRAQG
jgi:hypothetical protein